MKKSLIFLTFIICILLFAFQANANNAALQNGDVNGDEKINLNDLIDLAQYVAEWENIICFPEAADVNSDSVVDLNDIVHLAKFLAGWNVNICNHTIVTDIGVAPTCTKPGLTEGKHCSDCNAVLVKQELIPATGKHNYKYTVVTDSSTQTTLTHTCTVCNDTYTEIIEPIAFTITADNRTLVGYKGVENENLIIPTVFKNNGNWYRVTNIDDSAFYGCSNLVSVNIPDSVLTVGGSAFAYSSIIKVSIGTGVKSIGYKNFAHCYNLTDVEIKGAVSYIGFDAFRYCTSLEQFDIPDTVTFIDGSAFSYTALKSISIPASVSFTSSGYYSCDSQFYGCNKLTTVIFENNSQITKFPNYLFNGCESLEEIIIPNSVTSIGYRAFSYCKNLKFVEIPSSVINVDSNVFYGCGLGLVIHYKGNSIPSSWNSAWNYSCSYTYTDSYDHSQSHNYTPICSTNNYIGKTTTGFYWFQYGGGEIEIIAYSGHNANVVIPETINGNPVKFIREYAFCSNTNMVSVTLPSTLSDACNAIGNYAFIYCNNLKEVINKSALTITVGSTNNGYVGYYAMLVHNGESAVSEIDGYVFFKGDNTVYLMKYIGTDTELVLPTDYRGTTYEIYKSVFQNNTNIKSVIITNAVTEIGSSAFSGCSKLQSIIIPEGVTSISDYAFEKCSSLTSIDIPNSVKNIGPRAFYNCTSITSVSIGNGITNIDRDRFNGCTSIKSITVDSGNTKYYVIDNCLIEKATNTLVMGCNTSSIPDCVTNINSYAFCDCPSITSIIIPNGVTSIGNCAFSDCTGLTSIILPESLTTIGASAFFDCKNLSIINIPNNVTTIGNRAFSGCSKLQSIIIPEGITKIDEMTFYYCSGLTSITLPNSITKIGNSAFCYCNSLTNINIPNSVTNIGSSAFASCISLTSITIPNNVTNIGSSAFSGCSKLQSIIIPEGITSISNYTFEDCTSLANIIIPNSVTKIDGDAFENCVSLVSIAIPKNVTNISSGAFEGCYKLIEVINKSALNIYTGSSSNGYVAYYAKTVHSGATKIVNQNDYLFFKYNNINYLLGYIGNDTELTLPDNYNGQSYQIYEYAFYGCSKLTNVTIGNSVTIIGSYAFEACSELTSITIPNSVTKIGRWAFRNCKNLDSIIFEDTSTWYYVWSSSNWNNMYGGTSISVTNSSTNATYFKSTYVNEYWYKK